MKVDDIVFHHIYGECVIIKISDEEIHGVFQLMIKNNYNNYRVSSDEVELIKKK